MKWSIPERIVEKGRRYLNEGRVLSVTSDEKEKLWHAQVMGHELYLVDLDGTPREKDTCQCLFWQEKGYCKHTVAVELYLRQQGLNRVMAQNNTTEEVLTPVSFSKIFSQGLLESKWTKGIVTENLKLTYQVENITTSPYHKERDLLGLSLKIGYPGERQYVVKNLGDFLKSYEKEETIVVNQQYTFSLAGDNFSKVDKEILDQLYILQESQQMLLQGGFVKKGKAERKYMLLPSNGLKPLLEKIFASGDGLLLVSGRYEKVAFLKSKPLTATLEKRQKNYALLLKDPLQHYFANYHLGFAEGNFYEFSLEEESIYQTINQLLAREKREEVILSQEELSQWFSKIFPILEKISTLQVAENLEEELVLAPLQTTFYFRKIKGEIHLEIDFQYGEAVFSTNPKRRVKSEKVLIRQLEEEEKILKTAEKFHYQKHSHYYGKPLPQGKALYDFFTLEVPTFQHLGKVKMGRKLGSLFVTQQQSLPRVKVAAEDSWLSVNFDLAGVKESEIRKVVAAILKQEQFYETKTGEILDLSGEDLQKTAHVLEKLRGKWQKDGTLKVATPKSLEIQQLLRGTAALELDEKFQKLAYDLTHPQAFKAPLPENLQAKLRDYQKEGYSWLKMLAQYELGGVLADEMGLGKTLQTIAFLLSQKQAGQLRQPALIVAPASLTYNWQSECEKFAPDLKVILGVGLKEERLQALKKASTADLFITSYASLRQDEEEYEAESFSCLILDEAQMVKNAATKTAQALRKLEIPQRFALSGTPIENNLGELWSLFAIIMPGFFPKKQAFKGLSVEEVSKMIQPFVLRREKNTVLKELPEKIETTLYSSLLPEQKTLYLAYLSQMQEKVSAMDDRAFAKNRLSILSGLTRLRQICCDPRMFMEDFKGESGKLEQLKEFLVNAKENGRRVLVFSQFTKMLSLIEKELAGLGLSNFYLRGSTPPKERLEMVNQFNEGVGDVFLISLKAGGTGLNLTGADTVVLYDLWWNPAVEEQAAGRAHRIGQKKVVEVFKMLAKGTIEEKMAALQEEKKALFQQVLKGQEEDMTKLTEEDIRQILSVGEDVSFEA